MNTQERNIKIDKICDTLHSTAEKLNNDRLLFLSKFEWEKLDILVDKYLDYYYKKQSDYNDKDEYRKYLKLQIEKYIKTMSSDIIEYDKKQDEYVWILIVKKYHELIYDWEHDWWIELLENEKKLEKKDRVKTLVSSVSDSLYNLFNRK